MRNILYILFIAIVLNGKNIDVDIQANSFEANELENIIVFEGNVTMVKEQDNLFCDKLVLITEVNSTTNKREIVSYKAIGNVNFLIKNDKLYLIGSGGSIFYDIKKEVYIIKKNGLLEDKIQHKMVKGDNIYIDVKNGYTKIDGNKEKPVKFKFTIKSEQ